MRTTTELMHEQNLNLGGSAEWKSKPQIVTSFSFHTIHFKSGTTRHVPMDAVKEMSLLLQKTNMQPQCVHTK